MPILLRVKDLPVSDRTHTTIKQADGSTIGIEGRPTMLYCRSCGGTWSATRGDYFMADPNTVLRCQQDRTPLVLAQEHTTFELV